MSIYSIGINGMNKNEEAVSRIIVNDCNIDESNPIRTIRNISYWYDITQNIFSQT
jgi:hypothetical protein